MNLYGTLTQLRARLPITSTVDDDELVDTLEEASRALDAATHRHYYPLMATKTYGYHGLYCLRVDDDLLSVTTLTTNNGGTTVPTIDYTTAAGDNLNIKPANTIHLVPNGTSTFGYTSDPRTCSAVVGVWGYHTDYGNAYRLVDTLPGAITATATDITIADASGYQRGQTLKIGDEWLYLELINTGETADTISVIRGINGSTAAIHAKDALVYVYEPLPEVRRIALRYAAWLYAQRQAPFSFEVQTDAAGSAIIPPNAPPEVHRFIKMYRRLV